MDCFLLRRFSLDSQLAKKMQQRVTSRQQAKLLAYNQAAQHFESLAYVKAAERCFEKCIDKNFQLDKSCHESCVDKFKQVLQTF